MLLLILMLLQQAGPPAVPVGEEPRHHVVFENAYVRVIDAAVSAGDTTLFHTHDADNVPVAVGGGRMKTEVAGGRTTESDVAAGGVWFAAGGYTHQITNVGPTPLRFIDAEVLAAPEGAGAPALDGVPGLRLEIENERVRVYRVRLAPGEATGPHVHAAPLLGVSVTAGDVAVRSGDAWWRRPDAAPGAFRWHPAGEAHTLVNTGASDYELIEIEWKPRE